MTNKRLKTQLVCVVFSFFLATISLSSKAQNESIIGMNLYPIAEIEIDSADVVQIHEPFNDNKVTKDWTVETAQVEKANGTKEEKVTIYRKL